MHPSSTVPPLAELAAAPAWRTVDFISDLHLSAGDPATFATWQHYLQATPADAVFILGDLFEVWVGDDAASARIDSQMTTSVEHACVRVLRQAADRLALFFMHGNRDFLVGPALMVQIGATLLSDPTVLTFADQRWLLSHGDALCLNDAGYQEFRRLVRSPDWQRAFLARPLAERQALAKDMRRQSEARKHSGIDYGDVDAAAVRQWLSAASAPVLIHGHTHKPARHDLGGGLSRWVLGDWDSLASVPRAEVLRLGAGGLERIALLSP